MNSLDVLIQIAKTKLINENLKYCLVSSEKVPFKIDNTCAKPNILSDFVDFETLLQCNSLTSYAGVGISIQASKICAIDVDHCFLKAFDINSADDRAIDILNRFNNKCYIEFSFSGTGMRLLFKHNVIDDYSNNYYIKNDKTETEFYQPGKSFRYVTITGMSIIDKSIDVIDDATLYSFFNSYMLKQKKKETQIHTVDDGKSIEDLLKLVKKLYYTDYIFQDLWFSKAPGSGSDESERDYHLVAYLYENVTQDKSKLKTIFEHSPFFKSKDFKHKNKWTAQNGRYFEYLYSHIGGKQ